MDAQPPPPDPTLRLPGDTYYQIVHTLRGLLPPPVTDTPEDLARRDNAAIARIASLLPGNADEANIAACYVAADAYAMDLLRLARRIPRRSYVLPQVHYPGHRHDAGGAGRAVGADARPGGAPRARRGQRRGRPRCLGRALCHRADDGRAGRGPARGHRGIAATDGASAGTGRRTGNRRDRRGEAARDNRRPSRSWTACPPMSWPRLTQPAARIRPNRREASSPATAPPRKPSIRRHRHDGVQDPRTIVDAAATRILRSTGTIPLIGTYLRFHFLSPEEPANLDMARCYSAALCPTGAMAVSFPAPILTSPSVVHAPDLLRRP